LKIKLKDKLNKNFLKIIILLFFTVIVFLLTLFIIARGYMFDKIISSEIEKAKTILEIVIDSETKNIEGQFSDIESYANLLQREHQKLFSFPKIIDYDIKFNFAQNGAFYKTTKIGSSLYYSSTTKITKKEREKALFSEEMDSLFKSIVEENNLVVSTYFNSYDNMIRIYPYIDNIYGLYGSAVNIKNYNFYYLADKKNNPKKETVWTDVYFNPAGNSLLISCITPIYNALSLEGVTGLDISIEKITEDILDKKLPFDTNMAMVSKNGTLISISSELKNITDNKNSKKINIFKSDEPLFKSLSTMVKDDIYIKEVEYNNDTYLFFNKKIDVIGSNIIYFVKKSNILTISTLIKKHFSIVITILILLFTILLFFMYKIVSKQFQTFSKLIIEPITTLSIVSSNISKYEHNIPKVDTTILEIDELNKNLINMVSELKLKTLKLRGFNNTLENMVDKATKKLIDKNHTMNILLDTIMEAVVIWDENYNLSQINQVGMIMFGYDNTDDIIGKNIFSFIPKDEQSKAQNSLAQESVTPYELNLYRKGDVRFIALVKGSNTTINGENHRIITVIDLTDIKMKEEQLFQQSKHAQMGEMISMIAHQWRQPLNAISASSINLSLLSSMGGLVDSKVQEDSDFIQNQCQKMSSTIDTFINFVKPSQISKEFKIIDMLNVILNIMGTQLLNHNIKVDIIELDKDVSLFAHEDLIEQVIINLLSNARDAFEDVDEENKFIKIFIEKTDGVVIIKIEDNAGGIPKDVVEKIFNPYFTTKEQGRGTGLGLYMSKDIMSKSFSGDLIYKHTDNGSVFELRCGSIKNMEDK